MNRPGSAREALIAEALGDVATLLDRLDRLVPMLTASHAELARSGDRLSAQLTGFEARINAVSVTARTQVVDHIVRRTEEAARRARAENTKALEDAARAVLRDELGRWPAPQPTASGARVRWGTWLSHAATAAVASALTWAIAWAIAVGV